MHSGSVEDENRSLQLILTKNNLRAYFFRIFVINIETENHSKKRNLIGKILFMKTANLLNDLSFDLNFAFNNFINSLDSSNSLNIETKV
ncbi:hypothetical protein FF38_00494 [Lucilia cuprina]|uniref:Uncharacterized protein n=1 Tax=Lucilia cuprina TaxID=7375 RepID=A0A0L0CJC5_LUCCU|nr:hypothetical protein FF38_00494 [Lucilia cuprina]